MADKSEAPPEGILIQSARERANLSIREAARRTGMSDSRWRHVEKGYAPLGEGKHHSVRGPALRIARMARVVGVAPEELEDAGRADAAAKLRELNDPQSATARQLDNLDRRIALLKGDPKARRMLEAFVQMLEDNHPL